MKPRVLAVAALAALLLAIPTAAQAKGATSATISGGPGGLPGGPITLKGNGEPGSSTDLGMLAEGSGLYTVVFDSGTNAILPAAPTDRLGPRYTITWTFPDPEGGKDRKVVQHVYPYAAGGPVTFMPAGQPVLDMTTRGGWYQGFDGFRAQLIELGLHNRKPLTPATKPAAPTPAPASPQPTPAATPSSPAPAWPRLAAVAAIFLVLAAGAAYTLRRRTAREATATR
ncbi:MAG TPA: hypothetical protein VF880_13065 [Actinomycetes bacterium]